MPIFALPCFSFSLKFKLHTAKEWTCADSESPTFVYTVLRDQATGSAMYNVPVLQEETAGGHEQHKCTGSHNWNKFLYGYTSE